MASQINWLEDWKPYSFAGLSKKKASSTKAKIKADAETIMNDLIDKLYAAELENNIVAIKYKIASLKWGPLRSNPSTFILIAYLDPQVVDVGPGGGKPPALSPTTPPQP